MPFELKVLYGLPTNNEKEAVFAYSFYRLCQRAKKLDFIYVETEDGLVANEKSRFLTQLEHELPPYSGTVINYVQSKSVTSSKSLSEFRVLKTDAHRSRIEELLCRGISASAINTFISCPADFYYKYVVGLREPEKKDEVVHPSITGSILHDTLEELYTPYVLKVLKEKDIKAIRLKAFQVLDQRVAAENLTETMASGENRLEYLVMRRKLSGFIDWELSEVKRLKKINQFITIQSLEKKYKSAIDGIELRDGSSVVLSGFVDRIDKVGSELRIVDYKSGAVTPLDLQIGTLLDFSGGKKGKALQLLIYGLLVGTEEPAYLESGFSVGNVSLKNISSGLINVKIGESRKYQEVRITEAFIEEIKSSLNAIFDEMIQGQEHFYHDVDSKYCDFCIV